jgi:hypothetical protein
MLVYQALPLDPVFGHFNPIRDNFLQSNFNIIIPSADRHVKSYLHLTEAITNVLAPTETKICWVFFYLGVR